MIPRSLAVLRVVDAVTSCLYHRLPAQLSEYAALERPGTGSASISILPPPSRWRQDYNREVVESSVTNAHVAGFVSQYAASVEGEGSSGTPSYAFLDLSVFVEVAIAFNALPLAEYQPPTLPFGVDVTTQTSRRGYYYAAAIMHALEAHLCCDSSSAMRVSGFSSDLAGAVIRYTDQEWGGLCSVVAEIQLSTTTPLCTQGH